MQKARLSCRDSTHVGMRKAMCRILPILIVLVMSCKPERSADHCCAFSDIPHDVTVEEQGILLVQGSTSVSYDVYDERGQRLRSQALNKPVTLEEGTYLLRVNNSSHVVEIRAGEQATCSTGTLIVTGYHTDYYYVIDSINNELVSAALSTSTSLFPGSYRVRVNGTQTATSVRIREITEIRSGSLVVQGTTGEIYYVLDANNSQLNQATLGKPLSFLPGTYEVKVNNTSQEAAIVAGKSTELSTGTLLVNGLTDEYYYVTDTLGQALNFQTLNKPLAVFPGRYQVRVNNTTAIARVSPGEQTEFSTGSLMLTGGGSGYYYVLDQSGNQLNYNSLNRSLSFFPSEYTVKLGTSTRKATVVPGQLTSINAFH